MLGSHKSSAAGTYNVYTVPNNKTVEANVIVHNASGAVNKVTLYRSTISSPTAIHTIQIDSLPIDGGYERTALVLKAGDIISYSTDTIGTHVSVIGGVYDTRSNEISSQMLITSNTETVIYDNTIAKAGTVNICASMGHGSLNVDQATCELYISSTNAAAGAKITKTIISGTGTTGFEKTGLAIGATDKVICVTTNLTGQVATCVSGYTKG
jgi:hypothetical protein